MDHASGVILKKSSPNSRSWGFFSYVIFWEFIVLHFTFKSEVHFALILVNVLSFLDIHWVNIQLFQYYFPFVKKIIFPLYCFCFFVKDQLNAFM
jgi:hypothetical protein